jgi:hypothetical protein
MLRGNRLASVGKGSRHPMDHADQVPLQPWEIDFRPLGTVAPVVTSQCGMPVERLVLLVATLCCLTACQADRNSSAAPPTLVCGKVLWSGAAGLPTQDVSDSSSAVAPAGNYVLFRLSPTCVGSGRTLVVAPSKCADVDNAVKDSQDRVIAVSLLTHSRGCHSFRLLLDNALRLRVRLK